MIGFFSLITGHSVLEQRWWYFSQILLSIALAVSLVIFYGILKNKIAKTALLFFLTFYLSFIMVTSPQSNIDNQIFSPNTGIRSASTESEIRAAGFFVDKSISNISSDYSYFTNPSSSIPVNYYYFNPNKIKSIENALLTGKFHINNSVIAVREEIIGNPLRLFGQPYKLNYDPREILGGQGFSKIYDSKSVSGFLK
jgi:hypothetical protein